MRFGPAAQVTQDLGNENVEVIVVQAIYIHGEIQTGLIGSQVTGGAVYFNGLAVAGHDELANFHATRRYADHISRINTPFFKINDLAGIQRYQGLFFSAVQRSLRSYDKTILAFAVAGFKGQICFICQKTAIYYGILDKVLLATFHHWSGHYE